MDKLPKPHTAQALQTNPRLVWAILALVVLTSFFIHSKIQSWNATRQGELDSVNTNIDIASQANAFETWSKRAEEAVSARSAWITRLWTGPTPGIVSAGAQSTLGAMAGTAGLESVQVTVSSDPVVVNSQNLLRFEIVAIAKTESFLTYLVDLSTHTQSVLISELDTDLSAKQASRIRIAGYLPVQLAEKDGNGSE